MKKTMGGDNQNKNNNNSNILTAVRTLCLVATLFFCAQQFYASVTLTCNNDTSHDENRGTSSSLVSSDRWLASMIPSYHSGDDHNNNNLLVQPGDYIYLRDRAWDGAPVIIEEYKLIFFTTAKVGCTVFKQLFRRMMHKADWGAVKTKSMIPWNPETNGLTYLYDYNQSMASQLMTDPTWTRAIFVRDPKERLVSAYLDKVVGNGAYTKGKCCPTRGACLKKAQASIQGFFDLIQTCADDPHWRPQHRRMEPKYWPTINFVGHMETIAADTQRLLEQVGAWHQHGASGWGPHQNQSIFMASSTGDTGRQHATNARQKLRTYLSTPGSQNDNNSQQNGAATAAVSTPADRGFEHQVEAYYAGDYAHPVLNITKVSVFDS